MCDHIVPIKRQMKLDIDSLYESCLLTDLPTYINNSRDRVIESICSYCSACGELIQTSIETQIRAAIVIVGDSFDTKKDEIIVTLEALLLPE